MIVTLREALTYTMRDTGNTCNERDNAQIILGSPEPSLLALWVAIGTLLVKVVVVWIEMRIGTKVHSQAIQADARDNLADVLSSGAVICGVIGAQFGNSRVD